MWTPSENSQGLCLSFIQSVMARLNFQNICFREHLLMAAFIRFRSTCFSERLKKDALFIKQPSCFFLGKKHIPSFKPPRGEGISSLTFIMFSSLLFTSTLFKNVSLLAAISKLNIIYMKLIYIKGSFECLHLNNQTTALKKKALSRSSLKNFILQNCLYYLNIWGCGYYTKTG